MGQGMALKVGVVLMLAVGLFLFLPTVLVLVVAMLPTGAALVVDRSASRSGWLCVGGLNFAALAPSLFELWFENNTLEFATGIISNVFTLMLIYGAAAVGWIIYMTMPQVIASVMDMTSSHRIERLKAHQQDLAEEWGPEVAREDTRE
ncbi:hypothetical protein F1188_02475 [Roseospira marina]|uniref:Uncharacterized protein n=1 Tax=Roseospira marina TaxID=140057 RepID=A0A5M6IH56_9PROT|nr:hypothetical protein [Roseospira marina]KAA5607641.1 hypothetical protein F1188_02475 [Roseospira marina]MBB4312158.1 hypothetical protein [Roseospira marina]MBB5085826.1 hypothetical protein [Roseospira marina]